MKRNISIYLDISTIGFLEELAKMENRNKSNLLNEIIKNYYANLALKQKMKLLRLDNSFYNNFFEQGDK